jgi:hypothetical protein
MIWSKTILVIAWALIGQFTALIIFAVANAYVEPVALIILVPVTLMALIQIWFGDGIY